MIEQVIYEDFANGIIIQAAKDYRKILRQLHKTPSGREHQAKRNELNAERRSIERFFRSKWYRRLTTVDGGMILSRLQNEFKEKECDRSAF